MAVTVQHFIKFATFYNQTVKMMSAICVKKGGVALENYVGRFFAADVLEFIVEYGERLVQEDKNISPDIVAVLDKFKSQFNQVRDLVTPSEKPIYEMTLEEFEKVMNI